MGVYPLIFEPICKPRIWGGRNLQALFGKSPPETGPFGESWELVDLESDQSVVAQGPRAGRTLSEIIGEWGPDLLGRTALKDGRFPLLIKFIDACHALSVQVHPDDEAAAQLGGGARAKHEAWYVIHADSGASIYRGIAAGASLDQVKTALMQNDLCSILQKVPVRKGHAYFVPGGTVHAIGGGVILAEIQTPSDTTFRLFDWGRTDPESGMPRPLQVEQGLRSIRLDPLSKDAERLEHLASVWTSVTRLVRCEHFVMERVRMVEGVAQELPYQEMVIWIILEGCGTIAHQGEPSPLAFQMGDTVLIPAGLRGGVVNVQKPSMWLEVSVPIRSSLSGFDRPGPGDLAAGNSGHTFVHLNVPPRS